MRVLKFGGTSVGDAKRIMEAARIVANSASDDSIIVVVSATSGTTDALIDIARHAAAADHRWRARWGELAERHRRIARVLSRDGTATCLERLLGATRALLEEAAAHRSWCDADRDRLLATGERLTVPLMVTALMRHGLAAIAVDGGRVITTDCRFGSARIDHEATRTRARETLGTVDHPTVVVVPGFVAAAPDGRTTTLGRGGSDLSATTLGEALDADRVEIWTDVAGVFTAPPAVAPWARPIPWLTYDEADTLAWGGAKVLHPATLEPAARARLRVDIRSTLEPASEGTVITADGRRSTTRRGVAVAVLEPAALVSVRGRRGRLTDVITTLELVDPAVDLAIDPVSARVQAVGTTSWGRQASSVLFGHGFATSLTDDMALVTVLDLDHQRPRLERVIAAARLADESPRGRMATAVGETGCRFLIARCRLRSVLEATRIEAGGRFDRHHALRMAEAV